MSNEPFSKEELEALAAQGMKAGEDPSNGSESQIADGTRRPEDEAGSGHETVVRTVEFDSFSGSAGSSVRAGMDLIMDVNLQVTVELGRTVLKVRDVLALGPGAVVELDRHAGEPVDVVVNNKPIARGEVVVVDENFGVRITEIIDQEERDVRAKAA
ncbi:MAG: flagellar motor switch protein FliN [Armatimonadota bacterium]|nr:flagellar motor switch protein FliN [Armatimonadota bacterium]